MRSTLAPGRVPKAIADLRESATRECAKAEEGKYTVKRIHFDKPIGFGRAKPFDQDDNTIAKFPGLISPHVGNGKGAPK